jgi:hypothetical protein
MSAFRIGFFDTWQPHYAYAVVRIRKAGLSTLASVYTDEALTVAAANPQTLLSLTSNGVTYGKWAIPLYAGEPVDLEINTTDQTGIVRPPIYTLVGADASGALVTGTDGTAARSLADRADDFIQALDYGALADDDAATNTATLVAACGAAASGGRVMIPAGTWPFTDLTLAEGVVLAGAGRDVTILQCQTAAECITIGGDRAGLRSLTLDGVDLQTGSVGVFSKANDETVFEDVLVKRFETGLHFKGGRRSAWVGLSVEDCDTGAKLHGDSDAGNGADGDEWRGNAWAGAVSLCSVAGVDLGFEDMKAWHNRFDLSFADCTGTAMNVNGARHTKIHGHWSGNTVNLAVDDDDDTDNEAINTVIGLEISGSLVKGDATTSSMTFAGTCQDVVLWGMEISGIAITLTLPLNNVLAMDCIEDADVTVAGEGTKWTRGRTILKNATSGLTTTADVTKAWAIRLDPGQVGYVEAIVIGNMRNGVSVACYWRGAKVKRAGSTLAYDTQTANFTLGSTLTGGTSGATALIIADSDSGATGTLTLRDIEGEFEDNEIITDAAGGSATANGALVAGACSILQADTIGTDHETTAGWDCAFAANGPEIELRVTGAASTTINWEVHGEARLS